MSYNVKNCYCVPDFVTLMASLGHMAVGMAVARYSKGASPAHWNIFSSMVVWSGLSFLPDADMLGFRYGIAYGDPWGHRGATHSLVFSALLGVAIGIVVRPFHLPAFKTGVLSALVLASHAILDTLTDGGLGCALLWPFSDDRFFAPWRPLPVAPIGADFFSRAGLRVVIIELAIFAPLLLYACWPQKVPYWLKVFLFILTSDLAVITLLQLLTDHSRVVRVIFFVVSVVVVITLGRKVLDRERL